MVRQKLFSLDLPDFLDNMRAELDEAITHNAPAVFAINLAPADFVPSSFLAVLVGLRKHGVPIVLLHPSVNMRQVLEITRLNQLFVVRD